MHLHAITNNKDMLVFHRLFKKIFFKEIKPLNYIFEWS